MFSKIAIAFTVLVLAFTSGCETTTHAQEGQVIGGVLGGVVGSQVGGGSGRTAAIIVGAIAGSMIGQHVGQTMDETDRLNTAVALNDNRTGQALGDCRPALGAVLLDHLEL